MTDDLATLTATRASAMFAAGTLSPVELTRAIVDRIEAVNPLINAFCWLDTEAAMDLARASEARWRRGAQIGPLDGITFTVKDLAWTKGWPTRRGSHAIPAAGPWEEDCPSVQRMREAGAVILGKTTVPEFGATGTTQSDLCGVTRNPWNPDKSPGGSSGGSSASVAAGMGTIALASDAAGSVRWPASATGTFGLKTTHGRVPDYPASYLGTLAVIGPIANSVEDVALCMDAIARPDPRESYALPPAPPYAGLPAAPDLRGLRVLYSPDLGHVRVDPEVAAIVRAAVDRLAEMGAEVEETDHVMDDPAEMLGPLMLPGLANAFRRFAFTPEDEARMHPVLVDYVKQGRAVSLLDHLHAREKAEKLGERMAALHERFDLMVTPAVPLPPIGAEEEETDDPRYRDLPGPLALTYPFNITRQPAASLPVGLTAEGLPIGMQVVGPLHGEATILRLCRAYESAFPFARPDLAALAEAAAGLPEPQGIRSMREALAG